MIMKKRIILSMLGGILFLGLHSIEVIGGGDEVKTGYEIDISENLVEDDKALFDGFEELDYYVFLENHVGMGVSLDFYSYGIYGNITKTVRDGEELYFRLNNKLINNPLKPLAESWELNWMDYRVNEHIKTFSSDMEWYVTEQSMYKYSNYPKKERLYHGYFCISENLEEVYLPPRIEKNTICENMKTGYSAIMSEARKECIESLIDSIWNEKLYLYGKSRFCISNDGMFVAVVKPDNQHISIYDTEEGIEYFEFEFVQMDSDWPLEVSQINIEDEKGWIIFSNGDKTFQYFFPEKRMIQLGEFMFNTSISPDGKYCAYYAGSNLLYETWEVLGEDNWEKFEEMMERWEKIPCGWYIKEIDTGLITYIPVKNFSDANRPLLDGRCVWIRKEKVDHLL